tara:strand:- start:201 stop:344 length:144 start_codon:yes stop_codon:yes gene_type:complete
LINIFFLNLMVNIAEIKASCKADMEFKTRYISLSITKNGMIEKVRQI